MSPGLHLDVKTFVVASFPSEWIVAPELPPELEPLLPEGFTAEDLLTTSGLGATPSGSGIAAGRLRFDVAGGPWSFQAHHEVAVSSGGGGSPLGSASAGVGLSAPELVDLTWAADTGDRLTVRGRTDRLVVAWSPKGARLALGRQPVSFGTGLVFTPMDVVNPFSAATIDTEYKPGVDAARLDVFAGTAGKATVVAAWAGAAPPYLEEAEVADLVFAGSGQVTLGVTDLVGLAAVVRGDLVGGLGAVSSAGPVGVHGDVTVTLPEDEEEEEPFVRAVLGADGRPTPKTTISGEVYLQTLGADDPSGYLVFAQGERFARGELWTMGQLYAAVAAAQEITPLVSGSVAVIGNLMDPSALVAPGLSVSVSDDAVVAVGGFLGVGAHPETAPLVLDPATFVVLPPDEATLAGSVRSEFGLYPHTLYVQMKAWF